MRINLHLHRPCFSTSFLETFCQRWHFFLLLSFFSPFLLPRLHHCYRHHCDIMKGYSGAGEALSQSLHLNHATKILSLSLSLSLSPTFSLHSPHPSSQLFAQLNPRLLSIPIQSSSSPSVLFLKIAIILETLFIINFSAKFLISPSSQLFTSQHHSRSRDDDEKVNEKMFFCLF